MRFPQSQPQNAPVCIGKKRYEKLPSLIRREASTSTDGEEPQVVESSVKSAILNHYRTAPNALNRSPAPGLLEVYLRLTQREVRKGPVRRLCGLD